MSRGVRFAGALGLGDSGRALRDFATYLPTQLLPALAGFLVLPVLARQLSTTELGVLAICQTAVSLGWTVVGAWVGASILRELPAHRAAGDMHGFAVALRKAAVALVLAFALYAGLVAAGGTLSSAIGDNYVLILAATGGFLLHGTAISLFAAGLRPRAYAVVDVGARVGGTAVGVVLVFHGEGIHGYLGGLAAGSALFGLMGLIWAWPRRTQPGAGQVARSGSALAPWLRYGIPASAASIAIWLLTFVDRYILADLRDASAVGVYTVSSVIGDRIVSIPVMAFFTAAGPLLVTAFERRGLDEVERLMRAYTRIAILVAFPCIAFVAVTSGDLVWILTGEYDYVKGSVVAPIIAGGSFLYALAFVANTGLVITKRTRPIVVASSIGVVVNVALNLALIPPYGLKGAAIANPLGMGTYLACTYAFARGGARWRFPFDTLLRSAAASTAGAFVARAAMPSGGSRPLAVLIAAAAGAPVYLLVLALLREHRAGFAALRLPARGDGT